MEPVEQRYDNYMELGNDKRDELESMIMSGEYIVSGDFGAMKVGNRFKFYYRDVNTMTFKTIDELIKQMWDKPNWSEIPF